MEISNKYTKFHKLLHWLIALAMIVLFITGFLRMTWMNKNHIVSIIENKTQNIELSEEQMVSIAKTIREPMWEWHLIFAHIMIFSFITRMIYMFSKGIRFPNPFQKNMAFKERLQGLTYIYFYLFALINIVTGISLERHLFTEHKEIIESIHKLGIYWFPIFILLHLAGIIIAEFGEKKGIVSKMIGSE